MNIWQDLPKPFLILAPMEGVTDIMFRQVIAKAGRPDLFFTEFTNVSSYASEKGRANALERLEIAPTDHPIIAQIWGKNPAHFSECAAVLEGLGFSGIDLNFGCPDRYVNKTGGGAAMIRTPELAVECYRNARNSTNLPVSIKTRLGWSDPLEYQTWLLTLLAKHPAALTIHLRTKKEMSKVPAHYELIPAIIRLRDKISPETKLVINGDIRDRAHALELHKRYPEVDGFMIGRGVFANPYCFTDHTPTRNELMNLLKMHLDLYEKRVYESSRSISINGELLASEPLDHRRSRVDETLAFRVEATPDGRPGRVNGRERSGDEITHISAPPYEPLKHFFKIYINNFPGAKNLRAELMETHSIEEARKICP